MPPSNFDRIDLLVNNAGIYITKSFTNYTPADFDLMIGTNVAGYFFITQRVVAQMRKQKSGHILGISTVLVDQPLAGATISLPVNYQVHHSGVSPRIGYGIPD